jgi:hypothetical protein
MLEEPGLVLEAAAEVEPGLVPMAEENFDGNGDD